MTGAVTTTTRLGALPRAAREGPPRAFAYDDPDFADLVAESVRSVVARAPTEVVSLDVFDTMLLRDPTCELRRFAEIAALVAQRENRVDSPAVNGLDVLMARLVATHASYRLSEDVRGCREGTLTEIARLTAGSLRLDDGAAGRIVSHELDYEETVLAPNRVLGALVEELADDGVGVVFLSDMYLDAGQIRRLLANIAGITDAEVISSADVKVSKHSGLGYQALAGRVGVDPGAIVHIGDSLASDYQQARRNGLRAVHLPVPICERDEIARDHREMVRSLAALGIDISRWKSAP